MASLTAAKWPGSAPGKDLIGGRALRFLRLNPLPLKKRPDLLWDKLGVYIVVR